MPAAVFRRLYKEKVMLLVAQDWMKKRHDHRDYTCGWLHSIAFWDCVSILDSWFQIYAMLVLLPFFSTSFLALLCFSFVWKSFQAIDSRRLLEINFRLLCKVSTVPICCTRTSILSYKCYAFVSSITAFSSSPNSSSSSNVLCVNYYCSLIFYYPKLL